MGRARAGIEVGVPVAAAEALWYDRDRWPSFVDGFGHLVKAEGDWPREGARVVWDSRRGGRGRVVERVVAHQPGTGSTVEVEDPRLEGTLRIAFEELEGGVAVEVELEYRLKSRGFGGPVVDALFVRRALADSLRRTLLRFARELEAEREFGVL